MAETLTITDGTTSVSLISANGFSMRTWEPGAANQRILSSFSSLYDGSRIQSVRRDNVKETIVVRLKGSSQDNAAAQLQTLNQLLRQAHLYHTSARYTTPVYIQAQGSSETGARYSLLFNGYVKLDRSGNDLTFGRDYMFPNAELNIEREPYWRSHAPGDLPASPISLVNPEDTDANGTRQPVGNFQDETDLTHIYAWDNTGGGGTFSGNLVASSSFNYFEVSGSVPAANDLMYFGSTARPFHTLVLNLDSGYTAAGNITLWYWNGSIWFEIVGNTVLTSYPYNYYTTIYTLQDGYGALRMLGFGILDNWAKTTINGVNAYWLRIKLTNTPTGTATQADFPVYTLKHNHLEIPATALDGDAAPKILLAMRGAGAYVNAVPNLGQLSRIYIGAKSRGLTNFEGCWGFNNQANGDFTVTAGTDGTITDDSESPGGQSLRVSFGTTATKAKRVTLSGSQIEDYIGRYRCFLRAQQIGGSAGDCTLSVKFIAKLAVDGSNFYNASSYETETVTMQSADANAELVDLGEVKIPYSDITNEDLLDDADLTLTIEVYATRSSGASTLRLYDLALLPIDEWHCTLNDPIQDTAITASALTIQKAVQMDGGVLSKRTVLNSHPSDSAAVTAQFPGVFWEIRGLYPQLEPNRQYRLYFILAYYNGVYGTLPMLSSAGSAVVCEIYAHEQWELLRGAD